MRLTGKELKQLFSSKKGVFINTPYSVTFLNCETGESKTLKKPKKEEMFDDKVVVYSDMFDLVKSLEDNKTYEVKVTFNFIIFEEVNENGETEFELGISGDRF